MNEWMNEWEGGGRLHEGGASHLTHYSTFVVSYYLLLAGCDITAQNERMTEWMNEWMNEWEGGGRLHEGGASHLTHYSTFVGVIIYYWLAVILQHRMNEWMNEWTNEKVEDDFTKGALVISPITPRSLSLIIYYWLAVILQHRMNEWMNEWMRRCRMTSRRGR